MWTIFKILKNLLLGKYSWYFFFTCFLFAVLLSVYVCVIKKGIEVPVVVLLYYVQCVFGVSHDYWSY